MAAKNFMSYIKFQTNADIGNIILSIGSPFHPVVHLIKNSSGALCKIPYNKKNIFKKYIQGQK